MLLNFTVHLVGHSSASPELSMAFSDMLLNCFGLFSCLQLNETYNDALKQITNTTKMDMTGQDKNHGYRKFCEYALVRVVQTDLTMGGRYQKFPFHILIENANFDAADANKFGRNVLHEILNAILRSNTSYMYDMYEIFDTVLNHPTANVTLRDKSGYRPVDICIHVSSPTGELPDLLFLHLIEKLTCHSTANQELIIEALEVLAFLDMFEENDRPSAFLDEPGADYFKINRVDKYKSLILALCESPSFDVNCPDEKGQTIIHKTAKRKNIYMTEILVNRKEFDPNIQDNDGNTALFHIIKNFTKCEDIGRYLKMLKPKLNLNLKNAADETLLTIGNSVADRRIRDTVQRILQGVPDTATGNTISLFLCFMLMIFITVE